MRARFINEDFSSYRSLRDIAAKVAKKIPLTTKPGDAGPDDFSSIKDFVNPSDYPLLKDFLEGDIGLLKIEIQNGQYYSPEIFRKEIEAGSATAEDDKEFQIIG